jgi:hypothetical protein
MLSIIVYACLFANFTDACTPQTSWVIKGGCVIKETVVDYFNVARGILLVRLVKPGMTPEIVLRILGEPSISGGSLWCEIWYYGNLKLSVTFIGIGDRRQVKETDLLRD